MPLLRKSVLATAIAAAMACAPAYAYQFNFSNPDIQGHLNTDVSVGAMWRTQNPDDKLAANGSYSQLVANGNASQINRNDSDNNFDTGLASLVYKITPELQLSWQNTYGLVVSGTYFYDQQIEKGHRSAGYDPTLGCSPTGAGCRFYPNNGAGDDFSDATKRYAGHYGRMLDTYVWGNFYLGDMPLTVQAGRQVINWGTSLFLTGGVNTANYYDLNALMMPGSQLKEALLPLDSLYFNIGLTYNLTLEGFYQFDWKPNFDAPAGSYWATNDAFPGHGADHVIVDGEALGVAGSAAFAAYNKALGRLSGNTYGYQQDQVTLKRGRDEAPKDSGQFGFKLAYLAESLNYTNLAFYFSNTHAKIPVVGTTLGAAGWLANPNCSSDPACATAQGMVAAQATPAQQAALGGAMNMAHMLDTSSYFMAYPEDIQTYGFSFSTAVGNLALSGELAYRPERYIVNEVPDNLVAELVKASASLANGGPVTTNGLTDHDVHASLGGSTINGQPLVPGTTYYLYDTVKSYTASLQGIYTFGPTFGANNLIALVEVGMEHLSGLDSNKHYASTASVMQLPGDVNGEGYKLHPNHPYATYLDATSWGYRAVLQAEYSNLIPQVMFKPSLRYAQDVNGNSAVGGNFMEGRRAATMTLDFQMRNGLGMALSGTTFWGADYSNKLADRDNVSLAVRYSF